MFIYLTPVAPKYRLKFVAGTAIVFSEPDDIVSASSSSGISESSCIPPVCCLLVPCPVSFGFCRLRILSITLWSSFSFNFFLRLLVHSFHSSPQELLFLCHSSISIFFCSALSFLGGLYLFHYPWV